MEECGNPACGRYGTLRRWPLSGRRLCSRCIGDRIATDVVERRSRHSTAITTLDGEEMYRGSIRMVTPGAPSTWALQNYDSHSLGEHTGDYVDVLLYLLEQTHELDEDQT